MHLLQIHEPGQTPLPHSDARAVGIDLGTTHTVVAVASEGRANVIHDPEGRALLPSVVHYTEEGAIVTGHAARELYAEGNRDALASIKRRMHEAATRIAVAGKEVTPVEVSAEILRRAREIAEFSLGHEVTQAVITVPAYFDDTARTATRHAAQLAGLEVLRLINEPTAAALAYGLEKSVEGIYAIYDLGGGTFDISLLKLEKGVFQVLATGGDTQLGGDDFDRLLAAHLGFGEDSAGLSRARLLKEALSDPTDDDRLARDQFETLIEPLLARTIDLCAGVLRDAKLDAKAVKGVVLVGGSTRVPLVRKKVEEFFGHPPLSDIDPDEAVALGAALQAETLTRGGDTLLLDVIPLSLGLETMGGLTEKLIHRNTPIPVSVSQEFTTWQDGQNGMQIHVVQGEREMVADNRSLARFDLSGIPALPAGVARVKVNFTVDADGLLTVWAEEESTRIRQSVEVQPSYGLSEEEIIRMLTESMERAREDITGRLLAEARVEAERAVQELNSALARDASLLTDAERKQIDIQIGYVREAVAGGDRDRIDAEMAQLAHLAGPFAQRRMDRAIGDALKGRRIDEMETKHT